jgi:hypothetical protein
MVYECTLPSIFLSNNRHVGPQMANSSMLADGMGQLMNIQCINLPPHRPETFDSQEILAQLLPSMRCPTAET